MTSEPAQAPVPSDEIVAVPAAELRHMQALLSHYQVAIAAHLMEHGRIRVTRTEIENIRRIQPPINIIIDPETRALVIELGPMPQRTPAEDRPGVIVLPGARMAPPNLRAPQKSR